MTLIFVYWDWLVSRSYDFCMTVRTYGAIPQRKVLRSYGHNVWVRACVTVVTVYNRFIPVCTRQGKNRHRRRSCLRFCSDWFDLRSMTLSSDRSRLAHVTGVSALLQRFGWDDQSRYFLVPVRYRCTVSTRSRRWWSLFLNYTRNRSRVVFLLNFGLASLLFLVNAVSDKPSKFWRSLDVVGITWKKLKSV